MIPIYEEDISPIRISQAIPISDSIIELTIINDSIPSTYYYDVSATGKDSSNIANTINSIRKHSHGKALQWILHNKSIVQTDDMSADFKDDGYSIPDEEMPKSDIKHSYIVSATVIDQRDTPSYISTKVNTTSDIEARTIALKQFKSRYPRALIRDIKVVEQQ